MKAQHQISFKRRRPVKPSRKTRAKVAEHIEESLDVVNNQVLVGERELKFARALSDTERHVRDASLTSLRQWLTKNACNLQTVDIDRLWKGLFYCIWMADKRPVITGTIRNVVDLTDIAGWPFMEGLFTCLMRDWFGIDGHRVDKYYELINAALKKCAVRITSHTENEHALNDLGIFLKLLQEVVWQKSRKCGSGLALHILDKYMDAIMHPIMVRAKNLPGNEVHKVFKDLMEKPLAMIGCSEGALHAIGKRIHERILLRLLEFIARDTLGLKRKAQRDMIMRVSKQVFAVASSHRTSDDFRKGLYDVRLNLKGFVNAYDEAQAKTCDEDETEEMNVQKPVKTS